MFPMVDTQENESQSISNGHQQRSPGVRESGGTLWINMKIPKEEQVKEDYNYSDDDQLQKMNASNRICHVCNKGFSSGKALGGHMRIHVQAVANKEFISGKKRKRLNQPNIASYKKRKEEEDDDGEEDDDDESGGVDTLRKKKSIFNNEPPITCCSVCGKNFPSMKSLFGHMRCHPDRDWRGIQPPPNNNMTCSASVDLSKAIGGWSVTAKRGRSCKPIIHDYSRNRSSEEEQQVHDAVHYLMLLAYGDSLKSRSLTGSAHKQGVVKEELGIRNSNSLSYKTTGTKKRTLHEENICRIKRRGRKMVKLKDLGSIQDAHQNTVFSTPEKYNERKNTSITNDGKPQVSSSRQVSSVSRNSTSGGARIMDFDLNELPLPEDDDEVAGNPGCVSYSSDFSPNYY